MLINVLQCIDFTCQCHPGFMGVACNYEKCAPGCDAHGTCQNGTCTCFDGFTGTACDRLQCQDDCNGRGACINTPACILHKKDCLAPHVCQCDAESFGASCELRHCPSTTDSDDDGCSGHGACQSTLGECLCQQGWWGSSCQYKQCPSALSVIDLLDSRGSCSGHGMCNGTTGRCSCDEGWRRGLRKDCNWRTCPGGCSGHGACLNGTCKCDLMFAGDSCKIHQCPGWTEVAPNDECSAHGQCDRTTGACDCSTGWIGSSCEVKSCPNECKGRGTCGEDGKCSCHSGWTGADCSARVVVHGVLLDDGADGINCFPGWGGPDCNTRLCAKNCSRNGVCVAGKCACFSGWSGRLCQHPACENECYYHGECKQGVCECDVGFHGRDCSQRHVENGVCNLKTGVCKCDTVDKKIATYEGQHWIGEDCGSRTCLNDCSGHGNCPATGQCQCDQGWMGTSCETSACPYACHGRGKCDIAVGKCECDDMWTGVGCEIREYECPKNCNAADKQGTCVKQNNGSHVCECSALASKTDIAATFFLESASTSSRLLRSRKAKRAVANNWGPSRSQFPGQKWAGPDCSERSCPASNNGEICSGNGNCKNGECFCDPLHIGQTCDVSSCPSSCSNNGKCILIGLKKGKLEKIPKCDCDDGFEGVGCDIQVCPGNKNCNNHGTCNPTDYTCVCDHGWKGVGCKDANNCPNRCTNHGECTEAGCHCDIGWEGRACDVKACPEECSGNGVCSAGGCECNGNFTGAACDVPQCQDGCSGHGKCLDDLLVCKCEDGWNGPGCADTWCKGGCGGDHGSCDSSGLVHKLPVCNCLSEWGGANCQTLCSDFCHGHGTCGHDETGTPNCECTSGYAGDTCTEKCPGECSGHGKCEAAVSPGGQPTCQCDLGFTGEMCKRHLCPQLCSGHGVCKADGVCECSPGYGGLGCDIEFYKCDKNCNDHGVCTQHKGEDHKTSFNCVCHHGWAGDSCQDELCDPLCLHAGKCENKRCMCPSGWSGTRCETKTCPYNCFNHGKCTDKGTCECEKGYQGESCHVRHVKNGECDPTTQTCTCHPVAEKDGSAFLGQTWQGIECDEKSCPTVTPKEVCSGHGHCQSDKGGECDCQDGWRSADCSLRACPNECSGYGTCSSGICECDDEHAGSDCSRPICPKKCSGHGTCSGEKGNSPTCTCKAPYTGVACDELRCPAGCSGHGVCEHHDLSGVPKCTCSEEFTGEKCDVTCPSGNDISLICGGHGECFAERGKAECICSPAYSGANCEAMCDDGCMGRGQCGLSETGVPTCRCDTGYSGNKCQFTLCLNDCSGNGSCDGEGKCKCDRNHEGEDCSKRRCPDSCSGHGTCDESAFSCDCVMGWLDEACSEKVSCTEECNNHGECMVSRDPATNTLMPQCSCHGEWYGPACGRKMCSRGINTLSCSGHGACGDNGKCTCDAMFEGDACEEHDCTMSSAGGSINGTIECSGHGTCQEASCVCDLGYTDSSCSIRECPSFEGKLCSGRGSCDPDGACACPHGWEGEACHLKSKVSTPQEEEIKTAVLPEEQKVTVTLEDLKEAKEKLIEATESSGTSENEMENDVKEVMEDAAKFAKSNDGKKNTHSTASSSMRFRQQGITKGKVKKVAKKLKKFVNKSTLEKETKVLETAAKKSPKEVEKETNKLVEDVEKEVVATKQKDTTISNALKPSEPVNQAVTKDTLKEDLEKAEENYEFAKAEGTEDVEILRVKVMDATEMLDAFTTPVVGTDKVDSVNATVDDGALGNATASSCPNGCSGNGECNENEGTCRCMPSFTGDDCSYEICASCLHGLCHDNQCICQTDPETQLPLYFGAECALRECPNLQINATDGISRIPCGGHGTCLSTGDGESDAACDCEEGFSGVGCSIDSRKQQGENDSVVGCNRRCTTECDTKSQGELDLYLECFQKCSQKCTGIELVKKKDSSSVDVPIKVEEVKDEVKKTDAILPEIPGRTTMNKDDGTKSIHNIISKAQYESLGEHPVPFHGRNDKTSIKNVENAHKAAANRPIDTEPTPTQKCEKCKNQLEKEAGEMDENHLGTFLRKVCDREGGEKEECEEIERKYSANQLHDGKNLNLALGRFCKSFFEVPCDEETVEKHSLRR